ncbi:glycosyltransferase [Bellilinea caldifistulae]|uniref:glycosyltransferase n=1 Tax=Bellilinea caldifistulae TaxID=360411 RepID=UPI0007806D85|nr:glycosyltransferase [Bellilinea caldifistulae]GAP10770.1 glycosyltransferase [Bellilinea caldifistulae]
MQNNTTPLVTIIIPAYNQGYYLGEAIQSCLNQTYPNIEIIVVDDGSTDNTQEVAHSYNNPKIKYLYKQNGGLSSARNAGIRAASGEYLSFLDSDDMFLPPKIELLMDKFKANPELGFVAGHALLIDQRGKVIPKKFETFLPSPIQNLILGNPFHVGSVMIKKEWQEKIGYFDETLRSYEDWDYWLRLAIEGCNMEVVPVAVSKYRFHTGQMTRNGEQMTTANLAVLEKTFTNPNLSQEWQKMKPKAYAHAHLRAAAHGFLSSDFRFAHEHIRMALKLDPTLSEEGYLRLRNIFSGWTDLPKTEDPVSFLERIYKNLPEELSDLKKESRQIIGMAALNQAFIYYHNHNYSKARKSAWKALFTLPTLYKNFGAFTVLVKSVLKSPVPLLNSQIEDS